MESMGAKQDMADSPLATCTLLYKCVPLESLERSSIISIGNELGVLILELRFLAT